MKSRSAGAVTRQQRGVTLIEVLITIVVLSLGLMGFAALEVVAMKSDRTALYRSYGTMYAYDIIDCMRANRTAAMAGNYNLDFGTAASGGSIAGNDMGAWKSALAQDLPGGQGKVTVNGKGTAVIEITWREGIESNRTLTFATQTGL